MTDSANQLPAISMDAICESGSRAINEPQGSIFAVEWLSFNDFPVVQNKGHHGVDRC